jgi:hypothetical protein
VDNGAPWGSHGDWPTDLALWLIGLGIEMIWNTPARPQENGVVERSQGTAKSWAEPATCDDPEQLRGRLERMDRIQREAYPGADGRSRREAHPGLAHSGRAYDAAREGADWDMGPVKAHLAECVARRRVDRKGRVSIYNRERYVGVIHGGKEVHVMFDPEANEWVFADERGQKLGSKPAEEIDRERIMGLTVTHRR